MSSHDYQTQTLDQLEQQKQASAANLLKVLDRRNAERGRKDGTRRESVVTHGIASNTRFENGVQTDEALTHVIRIGDSTLIGVSRDIIGLDDEDKQPEVTRIRVSVLPFGVHAEQGVSRTLLDVDPRELDKRLVNGARQPFEPLEIGRNSIKDATGNLDTAISGKHMRLTVDSNGYVEVIDHKSTNGTDVLNETDLMSYRDENIRDAMIGFAGALEASPQSWTVEPAADSGVAAPPVDALQSQERDKILEQHELSTSFWSKHAEVLEYIDSRMHMTGVTEPSILIGSIAHRIETIQRLKGLDPAMAGYLGKVVDACKEAVASSSNRHTDTRSSLLRIRSMISAITKE